MANLILLVGPPGSGKSTMAKKYIDEDYIYINQDEQGKDGHYDKFLQAKANNRNIVVDRMNFSHQQRNRYLLPKVEGRTTEIHVIHESYKTCLDRCLAREGHKTVKTHEDAVKAINFFFSNYERVEDYEADLVLRHYPTNTKPDAIICDLDGTLCNIEHRRKFVRGDKKNWPMFFAGIENDGVNEWCAEILSTASCDVVLCTGRGAEYMAPTTRWLERELIVYSNLFMRQKGDHRQDSVVKEIILDFEILTRYTPYFIIDDRKQVVDMWRKRGLVCLQCAEGDF